MAGPSSADAVAAEVPDAVAPPPRHPRFPLFDGLRAIAVLCVLVGHVPGSGALPEAFQRLLAHLNVGVVIFFVVSGFLLYRPFIAARAGGAPAPPVGDYAKRRFLRIFPAYWLALTVLTLLPWTNGVDGGNPVPQYALVHTLPVLGAPTCYGFTSCDLSQTWSLVTELTFYAMLPLYALAMLRLTSGLDLRAWMRVELGIQAVLATVSVLLLFVLLGHRPSLWISSTVIGSWMLFAFGMGLALASVALGKVERQPALVRLTVSAPIVPWTIALFIYVALSFSLPMFVTDTAQSVVLDVGLALVAFLLVLPAVFGDGVKGLPRRVLGHPLVAWIGLISYGIFLWHFAIAQELGSELPFGLALAVTLVLSIGVAAASYYVVERPILRLKYRRLAELLGREPARARG